MNHQPLRLAMWSGPRNISTAMMRSWENRDDCYVCDEPLYAHYLQQTGLPHPHAELVISSQPTDWREVTERLTGDIPQGKQIYYQKQMAHHLLPHIELDWLDSLVNCFLIRSPREMITSLMEFIPQPTLQETGLPQQVQLFQRQQSRTGSTPLVLDARDVLKNPRTMLRQFCEALGAPFSESMLNWPPGPRQTDGAWAPYWYTKVYQTTSFAPYRAKTEDPPLSLKPLLNECQELYQRLYQHRLRVD